MMARMNIRPDGSATLPAPAFFFDAVLTPHRSLSPFGFRLLMGCLGLASLISGAFFVLRGAWPVGGYLGLDVLLVYLAFKASYRSARCYETIRLSAAALVVERVGPGARQGRWSFQPYWLRVELDEPPGRSSRLSLSSHGRSLVVGAFLAAEERRALAAALAAALERQRRRPFAAAIPDPA